MHTRLMSCVACLVFVVLSLAPASASASFSVGAKLSARVKKAKKRAKKAVLAALYKAKAGKASIVLSDGSERALMPEATLVVSQAEMRKKQKIPGVLKKYRNYIDGGGGKKPPNKVSHRRQHTKVKDQGRGRQTCTVFAIVAAMERLAKKKRLDLSEEGAWHAYHVGRGKGCCTLDGTDPRQIVKTLQRSYVSQEKTFPYKDAPYECLNEAAHLPLAAMSDTRFRVKSYEKLSRNDDLASDRGAYINNPAHLEAIIASGYDVVFGMGTAGGAWESNKKQIIDVELDDAGAPLKPVGVDGEHLYHVLLLTGYNRKKGYFEGKNSWGKKFHYGGYVRLSYDYVRAYGLAGIYITAIEKKAKSKRK